MSNVDCGFVETQLIEVNKLTINNMNRTNGFLERNLLKIFLQFIDLFFAP